ncbi:bifunctional adenosylcobinamide kinase/adenosylcobinamide-phosphate guanylyltransferase [Mycolicibacterium komossense]|uniref:Adenosylcobinamide kinase n=1 Tax=Mycolicibacterium komossense TaxID=1779 RepID=A0ABT3C6E2_9MYCO|nr:bifunctional adenosylcobinamide kinase/adenosylcobinamide-phosphate guanylyltransferase [Mycolicibacterium komossense]MCV7225042.1 bifunctional adenosylcobinamide kinase/adenosylcobinamide-phosphate guanylyltransferase [Mycolicibacterium komossense]
MRTLVLGGIRSGKSRWAEEAIAESVGPGAQVRYLATGAAADDASAGSDWSARVSAHRQRRPQNWTTTETTDVATELRQFGGTPTLIDDVGNWLTAAMDRREAWEHRGPESPVTDDIVDLVSAVGTFGSPLVLVSPEVGLTVVPATASGRRFADALGTLNQQLAAACDRVVLVVAGLAIPIKPERTP